MNRKTHGLAAREILALASFVAGAVIGASAVALFVIVPNFRVADANPTYADPAASALLYVGVGAALGALVGAAVWWLSTVAYRAFLRSRWRVAASAVAGAAALAPVAVWAGPHAWSESPVFAVVLLAVLPLALIVLGLRSLDRWPQQDFDEAVESA